MYFVSNIQFRNTKTSIVCRQISSFIFRGKQLMCEAIKLVKRGIRNNIAEKQKCTSLAGEFFVLADYLNGNLSNLRQNIESQ